MKNILVILCLLVSVPLLSQESFLSKYAVTQLSMSDGLPHNYVNSVVKDDVGYLWLGMRGGGLCRYDGYEYRIYETRSNFINAVTLDHFNRLWVASDAGVDIIDIERNRRINDQFVGVIDSLTFSSNVSRIVADNDENVWFYSGNRLICVELDTKGVPMAMVDAFSYANFTAISGGEKTYVANFNRLYEAQIAQGEIHLEQINIAEIEAAQAVIMSVYAKDNDLWIGTDRGLYRQNIPSGKMKLYTTDPQNPNSLTQNRITSISETPQHEIVAGTLKGLNVYNAFYDNFEQIYYAHEGEEGLSSNFLSTLYTDGDALYIGTESGGLNIATPKDLLITNYFNTYASNSLSPNPVNAIIEDREGNIWIGNVESGLNLKRKSKTLTSLADNSNTFEHFTAQNHGLIHNSISCFAIDKKNHLWAGTWGGGVMVIDLNSPYYPVIDRYSFRSQFVGSVTYDPFNDAVWVGTSAEIAMVKDGKTQYPIDAELTKDIQGCLGALIDNEGNLWIGTSAEILIVRLNTFDGNAVMAEPSKTGILYITALWQSKDKTIYVGTNGYGLYRVLDDHIIGNITSKDGLVNNCVKGIAEDLNGNIWISTDGGVSMFVPETGNTVNYTKKNGLRSESFYWNAFCRSTSGKIYFGTLDGLTEIAHSNNIAPGADELSAPVFTSFDVEGEPKILNKDVARIDGVKIHERDRGISIGFSALKFGQIIRYQCRLQGFDKNWADVDEQHYATYTNLPAGSYILQVRYIDSKGFYSPAKELQIDVEPFFYKTFWFYTIIVCLFILLVYRVYRYRTQSIIREREHLQKVVDMRTRELMEQQHSLENKTLELTQQNQILVQQKRNIVDMSKKIQTLTEERLNFFTNISHEFRSPITLIIGPVQRVMKMTDDPKIHEQLQLVVRSSQRLLHLVNQLMDFRKLETGNFELKPSISALPPFLVDTVHPFAVYASERNIEVREFVHLQNDNLMLDWDALSKIISNLLSNAIKFTPDNGRIDIFVFSLQKKLYINVRDTGRGVTAGDEEKIFERFYQGQSHEMGEGGTGVGLHFVKRLIEQMKGTILAKNNKKSGLSVRMMLPITEIPSELAKVEEQLSHKPDDTEDEEATPVADEKMTILVVEDNADMRKYIRSILEEKYNIVEAKDGMVGLTALVEHEIDFIIADLMMPVMNGLEFADKVKKNFAFSHIPILILTAQLASEYRTESYKIGVESYLHKPFEEETLLARIDGILSVKQKSQEKFQYSLDTDDLEIDTESDDNKFVHRVLEHIKENYTDPDYGIDDILREVGCSKSMLNKKMQNVVGLAPGTFIRAYRLRIARQMIVKNRETKTMNISQIAYEVGFNDPKYFTRCFTKHFGITPSSLLEGEGDVEVPENDKLEI